MCLKFGNNLRGLKAIQNIYLDLIRSNFGEQVFYTSVGLVKVPSILVSKIQTNTGV
jgi:hypothetical protein